MESNNVNLSKILAYNTKIHLLINKVTEGLTLGHHKGKRRGIGTEFSEYRIYQPGDDVRLIDWKMYGRSDRFYIRESEAESSFTFRFFLDDSDSMDIRDSGMSKKEWELWIIYILSHIGYQQKDALYFYSLSTGASFHWNHNLGKASYISTLNEFSQHQANKQLSPSNLELLQESLISNKTEWWILFSDFIEENEELSQWISSVIHPKRTITCFRIKTPSEHTLPSETLQVVDIENSSRISPISPNQSQEFTKNYTQYFERLSSYFRSLGIEWVEGDTSMQPDKFIKQWIKHRDKRSSQ